MGRSRSPDPGHPARRRHPSFHLQPIRTRHCRTR
nr:MULTISPECIES: hypothetical protein [Pseudomonas]